MSALSITTVRQAMRGLMRERSVVAVALVSLAVGIAANATVFSLVQAVEFPSLIYPDSSRIVFLESRNDARDLVGLPVSVPDARDVVATSHNFTASSVTAAQESVLREGGTNRRISGRRVEAAFFQVLGVAPALGRALGPSDADSAIVLGDDLWRTVFNADPSVVGRSVRLDGGEITVVGVMPPTFDTDAQFWTLIEPSALNGPRDERIYTLFARLAAGASADRTTQELTALSQRLAAEHPATNAHWWLMATPLTELHGRDAKRSFLLFQVAVAFVLLIVCANVANILLARGARRWREMALRVSLGATRGRLLAELLIESLVLSLTGGVLGVILAVWGVRLARSLGGYPDAIVPMLNWMVVAFTAGIAVLTGVICGLVPALRASSIAPDAVLRSSDARTTTGGRGPLGTALVAIQIACSVVLVTCGALMMQTLANRERVDLGFDPRGAIRGDVGMHGEHYGDLNAVRQSVAKILDRVSAEPGVSAAGAITFALPTAPGGQRPFSRPRDLDRPLSPRVVRGVEAVTPGYFDAIGMPLSQGRSFTATDGPGGAPVAIINTQLAAQLWPDRSPIGEPLRLGAPGDGPIVTVVGVVASVRRSAMHDVIIARAYLPFAQYPNGSPTFVVRAPGVETAAARSLDRAVHDVDADLVVDNLRTEEADVARFVAPIRLTTRLLEGFGLAGLLLAALGVFGAMRYRTSMRQRELAVRSALGASAPELAWLVVRGGLLVALLGIVPGLLLAVGAAQTLRSSLFGVSPTDPTTVGATALLLGLVALAACYGPARTAARADPLTVLRQD